MHAPASDTGADTIKNWEPERQLAFWINAYNAFVLRTVIDHYPIAGRAAIYPRNSIRQSPGSFEKRTFRAAGRTLTALLYEVSALDATTYLTGLGVMLIVALLACYLPARRAMRTDPVLALRQE